MRFYVVDPLFPQWPSAPVETKPFANVQRILSTMWVPFPRSMDPSQMDAFIAESCPSFVLRSDLAMIGLHPSSARVVLQTPDILDDVAQRGRTCTTIYRLPHRRKDRNQTREGPADSGAGVPPHSRQNP